MVNGSLSSSISLAGHPRRTSELVKQLGTSYKVLSDQLREMSDAGLVIRKSFNTIPPHVEYRLTPEGENLYAALRYLKLLGVKTEQNKLMTSKSCVLTK